MNAPHDSAARREWSDLDLELYHDGEFGRLERSALSEALLESPALRERLGRINRLDAAARDALSEPAADSVLPRRSMMLARRALAVAACLALAAVIAWSGLWARRSAPGVQNENIAAGHAEPAPQRPSAVRVVLSIPMSTAGDASRAALDEAVARGDTSGARAAFAAADQRTRDEFLRTQGEAIRSAARAEAFLDSLSAEDQLAACRVWSDDPRLRPAAFARLDRLRERSEIADQYRAVMTHLSSRAELGPWLRSYVRPVDPARPALQRS